MPFLQFILSVWDFLHIVENRSAGGKGQINEMRNRKGGIEEKPSRGEGRKEGGRKKEGEERKAGRRREEEGRRKEDGRKEGRRWEGRRRREEGRKKEKEK